MRERLMGAVVLAVACAAWPAEARGAGTGRIVGTITPAGQALRVGAVERIPATIMKLRDKRHWGTLDAAKGTYVIDNLAPGTFDLCIETKEGRIEGLVLKVLGEEKEATYDLEVATGKLSVQRFDVTRYTEEGQVLSPAERDKLIRRKLRIDKLLDYVRKLLKVARFMDVNRPLYVHGTRKRAVALMELVRGRQFYAGKEGETIWRAESWPFIWTYDVWHKPRKGLRVWQRKRMAGGEWARLGYVFDPRLGGIGVHRGKDTKVDYQLPPKLPASMGKVPG